MKSRPAFEATLLFLLLVLPLVLPAGAFADSVQLEGKVTDTAGRPIDGVQVTLTELARRTQTTADGSYSFDRVPAGRYTVLFQRVGFAPVALELALPGPATRDVVLSPTPYAFEPIDVTAARMPRPVLDSPLPISFLSGSDLERETSISVSHALEQIPGVRTVSTGGQIGKPMIRGLTGPRVLVLDNGHRLEDYSWSDEDGPSIDPASAERIEVIRGPMSVLYGSEALGGVVNAVPPALMRTGPGRSMQRGLAAAYFASNSREAGAKLRLEGARGAIGWRLSGAGRLAEALHTPEGELENTGFGAFTGDAAVGWHGPRGGATLRYVRYGGEFKLLEAGGPPSGGQEGEGEEGGPERKLSDDRLQLESEFPVGPVRLEAKAQLERHELIELSDEVGGGGLRDFPRLRPATMPSLPVASRSEQEAFHLLLKTGTLDLLAHHDLGSGVGGTIGASGELQSNDSRGPIPLVPDLTTQSGAVFLYEEARFGRLSLLGGARTEARSFTREKDPAANSLDVDRSFHEITANGGIVLRLPHAVAAAGNVGRAWRAPTFFELYGGGPLLAEARFLFANHRLRQETSLDLDGSIRLEQPERRGEISVYRNAVDDFIVLSPTSEEINGLQVWKYRQVDAVLLGVDAALDTRVSGPFWLHGRIDYVKGEEEASDAPLPSIPPMRGAVGARLATGGLSWADRLQIELEVEMVADKKARDAAANEVVTGGYALLNGGASVSRAFLSREWDASLRVRNATNRRYRDFLSRYKAFALNPGIDVALEVGTSF